MGSAGSNCWDAISTEDVRLPLATGCFPVLLLYHISNKLSIVFFLVNFALKPQNSAITEYRSAFPHILRTNNGYCWLWQGIQSFSNHNEIDCGFRFGGAGWTRTNGVSYVTDLQSAAIAAMHTTPYFVSGRGGGIRTHETKSNRFTVCPLWPLAYPSISKKPDELNRIESSGVLLRRTLSGLCRHFVHDK